MSIWRVWSPGTESRTAARKLLSTHLEAPTVRLLIRLRLTPNRLTLLGLLIAAASAYLLSVGQLAAGGAVLLASGTFDLLDGAVARATGQATSYGAILDSVVDRASETVVLLGLLIFYLGHPSDLTSTSGAVLVYITLAGSLMVSYVRARAEGLGVDCKVGIMTRPERVVTLGIGLIVGQWWLPSVSVVLAAIAALALSTTTHRILHVWRVLANKRDSTSRPDSSGVDESADA